MKGIILLSAALAIFSCNRINVKDNSEWVSIFNGRDLEGWTVKITGYPVGENYKNTFRAEDGILKVSYEEYQSFNGEFGHIFYSEKLSSYRLKVQYRFTGDQLPGGPEWGYRNSGILFHSQDPATMEIDQDFPVSLEAQFLGGDGVTEISTLNLCTPGTNVMIKGELVTDHCVNSRSATFHGDQWVTAEIVVYADSIMHHIVNGDTVISYRNPQVGGDMLPESYPLPIGTPLDAGYISLQSESHPVEFREIMLQRIK